MIPASFDYKRASSVAEALEVIKSNPNAKILAGGHSLIPALKLRLNYPSILVDIARIPELNFIRDRGKYFAIGAATTHGAIAAHKSVQAKLPLIAHAASLIGDVQVRNKGTIGGSIAHADPASDWPAVLIAAEAVIKTQGQFGDRSIPAADFFTGFFTTELTDDEIITEIHIPDPTSSETPEAFRSAYEKFAQPASRFAIAGCAVQVQLGEGGVIQRAKVALNGVSSYAYAATAVAEFLVGRVLSRETAAEACAGATAQADMILSDHYADEAYRVHLAQVVCRRAIENCMYD
jgi:carbon-monoxide dehydrogenase medium subunit